MPACGMGIRRWGAKGPSASDNADRTALKFGYRIFRKLEFNLDAAVGGGFSVIDEVKIYR